MAFSRVLNVDREKVFMPDWGCRTNPLVRQPFLNISLLCFFYISSS